MSIRKRSTLLIIGMFGLVLLVTGVGIGMMVWLQSWHGDFVAAAQQKGALQDPVLQSMVDDFSSRDTTGIIVLSVLAVPILLWGVYELRRVRKTTGRKLQMAAGKIASLATELMAAAAQMAAAAGQAAAATSETTATVEEVRQTATLAEEKATEAEELSNVALEGTRFGEIAARKNQEHFERHAGFYGHSGRRDGTVGRAGPVRGRGDDHGERYRRAVQSVVGERLHRGSQVR